MALTSHCGIILKTTTQDWMKRQNKKDLNKVHKKRKSFNMKDNGDRVKQLLKKIKLWLKKNALDLHEQLNPPADNEDISRFSQSLKENGGIRMLSELRALWKENNGIKGGFLFPVPNDCAQWLEIDSSINTYEEYDCEDRDNLTEDEKVYIPDGWAQKRWIPFAWVPNGGELFVDLCPGPKGNIGQIVHNDSEGGFKVLAPGLVEYLQWIADGLEQGDIVKDADSDSLIINNGSSSSSSSSSADSTGDSNDIEENVWTKLFHIPCTNVILEEDILTDVESDTNESTSNNTLSIVLRIGKSSDKVTQDVVLSNLTSYTTIAQLKHVLHTTLFDGIEDGKTTNSWKDIGLEVDRQRYLYRGGILNDSTTLADLKLEKDSIITVNIRPILT
jgi:cell wall assembly regulator SMI1